MKTLCAWCQAEMTPGMPGVDEPITHGICAAGAQEPLHLEREPLHNILNRFHGPVLLVAADGRVITANREGYAALRKQPEKADGSLGGDVINCTHTRKPGGCGHMVHCKTGTIRMSVKDTLLTLTRTHQGPGLYGPLPVHRRAQGPFPDHHREGGGYRAAMDR